MTEVQTEQTSLDQINTPLKTNVIFIIDESGSMASAASDVRGGFNTYVQTLKDDSNEYSLTALKFGTNVRPLFTNLPLSQVPELTVANYRPLDGTALYDAIGYGFASTKQQSTDPVKPDEAERYLMIIMTDGFENSSREFDKETIVKKMKEHEASGYWTFVYLGADQDAWPIASQLGFAQGNVMSYASADTGSTFSELASSTTTTSSSGHAQTRRFFGGK